ncbi:hypothetical protein ACWNYO_00230 [Candidatus Vidania fulgoroideorum]
MKMFIKKKSYIKKFMYNNITLIFKNLSKILNLHCPKIQYYKAYKQMLFLRKYEKIQVTNQSRRKKNI